MCEYALDYYFGILDANYCKDFINYYDIGESFGLGSEGQGQGLGVKL